MRGWGRTARAVRECKLKARPRGWRCGPVPQHMKCFIRAAGFQAKALATETPWFVLTVARPCFPMPVACCDSTWRVVERAPVLRRANRRKFCSRWQTKLQVWPHKSKECSKPLHLGGVGRNKARNHVLSLLMLSFRNFHFMPWKFESRSGREC